MSAWVSREDKAAFCRDGVVCLRNVLTAEEVEQLRAAVARQMETLGQSETAYDFEAMAHQVWSGDGPVAAGAARRFDLRGLKSLLASDPAARPLQEPVGDGGGQGLFFYDAAGWRDHPEILNVAAHSRLPAIAGTLLSARQIQFWEDTTFVKAPGTRQKTAWHQDLGYFQIEGDQCLIAWIPLDPAGLRNGVTRYVRGSHRWGEVYAPNIFISPTTFPGAPGPRCPDIDADPDRWDIVSFEVEPGDVILHHVRTLHGAGGNPSADWRRAVSFRYCGEGIRYWDRPGATPQIKGAQGHGDGDILSPEVFPVVWKSGTS